MNDLSVIIVTWNCKDYVLECLRSIAAVPVAARTEVIVVDNCSTDGSVDAIRRNFPDVRVIENSENKGFAAANNQAINASQSRYVLLLNPDTLVHDTALDTMVAFMDRHPMAGALGPSIRNSDGSPQRTGVQFPRVWNLLVEALFLDRLFPHSVIFGSHKALYKDFRKPLEVEYVQGSCLMLRRTVLDKVGLLDESFFMYFEETDLCYRVKAAEAGIVLIPDAAITHFGGGEVGHFTERRLLLYHQSLFLFFRKHYSRSAQMSVRMVVFIRSIIRIVAWMILYAVRPSVRSSVPSILTGYGKLLSFILSRS